MYRYVDVAGLGAADHFRAIGVEVLEPRHGEVVVVQSWLIQEFDSSHSTSIYSLRELLGEIAEDV